MSEPSPPSALLALRAPILVLVLAGFASGGGWFASHSLRVDASDELDRLRAAVTRTRDELARAQAGAQAHSGYAVRFENLGERGLLAGEDRLGWVEQMQDFGLTPGLDRLQYELAPRRTIDLAPLYDLGPYSLTATGIELNVDLLHEGDLMALFEMLRVRHGGLVMPQQCTMERLAASGAMLRLSPRIALHCRLVWLAIGAPEDAGRVGHDAR